MSTSTPNYGLKVSGIHYPVFEQPLGVGTDSRFYAVNVNKWLKGRTIGAYTVTSEDNTKLTIDSVDHNAGIITFRAKDGSFGYQVIKVTIPTVGASITRRYCIKVKEL